MVYPELGGKMKKIVLIVGLVLAPALVFALASSWIISKEVVPDVTDDVGESMAESSEMPAPRQVDG